MIGVMSLIGPSRRASPETDDGRFGD